MNLYLRLLKVFIVIWHDINRQYYERSSVTRTSHSRSPLPLRGERGEMKEKKHRTETLLQIRSDPPARKQTLPELGAPIHEYTTRKPSTGTLPLLTSSQLAPRIYPSIPLSPCHLRCCSHLTTRSPSPSPPSPSPARPALAQVKFRAPSR